MSDYRSVVVALRADVDGFVAKMAVARESVASLSSELTKTAQRRQTVAALGTTFGVMGAAAAAGIGLAIKASADYQSKLAQIRSLAREASAAQLAQLDAANHGYSSLGVSASQAADAEIELVKAGISVKDILGGGLKGTLTLAAAGQMNVGDATEIAAEALTQFGLKGADIPRVADMLAAGADKALGSVQDLGEGLSQAGLGSHQLGASIQDTVGTLAAFAQAGLIGERGGTTLKQMFLQLAAPTGQAQKLLDKYNISLYNAQGNFVGISNLAGQLRDNLSKVPLAEREAALGIIFGTRAVQGANILYANGAKGMTDWINKVNDTGFAAQQARGKMDSLSGDLDKLKAEVVNTGIDFGNVAQGPLRVFTKGLTDVFGWLDRLPAPLKLVVLGALALTAATGGTVFAISRLVRLFGGMKADLLALRTSLVGAEGSMTDLATRERAIRAGALAAGIGLMILNDHISKTHANLKTLNTAASDAFLGFAVGGPIGAALGAGIGLVQSMYQSVDNLNSSVDAAIALNKAHPFDYADAIARDVDQMRKLQDLASKPAPQDSIFQWVPVIGPELQTWNDHLFGNAVQDNIKKVHDNLVQTQQALLGLSTGTEQGARNIHHMGDAVGIFGGQMSTATSSVRGASDSIYAANDAWHKQVRVLASATSSLKNYKDALNGLLNPNLDLQSALDNLQKGYLDLADDVKQNIKTYHDAGTSLSGLTREGLANRAALRDQVTAIESALAAEKAHGASVQTLAGNLATYRGKLLDAASAAGFNRQAVAKMLDQYGLTPKLIATMFKLTGTSAAELELEALNRKLSLYEGRHYTEYIDVKTRYIGGSGGGGHSVLPPGEAGLPGHATGGMIGGASSLSGIGQGLVRGAGSWTSDSILARLSAGEWVTQAAVVAQQGLARMAALNSGNADIVPRYAEGGGWTPPSWLGRMGSPSTVTATVVVHTDSAVLTRLERIESRLARGIDTRVVNADEVATGVRGATQQALDSRGNWQWAQRVGG